jgi:putative DNA-invertase from lambdoid prophage Rac
MSDSAPSNSAPRAFGLCRASTVKQVESCGTQTEMIEEQCRRCQLPAPTILEEPLGTSGKIPFARRPMGAYLLRTLRSGDNLVVVRVDRLGRNMIDIYATVQVLCKRGVRVMVLRGWNGGVIDLDRSTDQLFLMILAWVAQTERTMIAERTREGLAYRAANGLCIGLRLFTYIQAFNEKGEEIPKGEFNKVKGHYKQNLPDSQWIDQLITLIKLQQPPLCLRGNDLYDYCRRQGFVNRHGKEWWNTTVYTTANGTPYRNSIQKLIKQLRRMAVRGVLPGDYNEKVLLATGDTPAILKPKFKRPPKAKALLVGDARARWTLEDWQAWHITGEEPPQNTTP